MSKDEIRRVVLRELLAVAPEIDPSTIVGNERLRDQVDIDSVDFLNWMVGLERALGVEVPESAYGELVTLDGCVDYLAAHSPASSTSRFT